MIVDLPLKIAYIKQPHLAVINKSKNMTRVEKLKARWANVEAVAEARKTKTIAEIAKEHGISMVTVSNWTRLHALGFDAAAALLAPRARASKARRGPKARLAEAVALIKSLAATSNDLGLIARADEFIASVQAPAKTAEAVLA